MCVQASLVSQSLSPVLSGDCIAFWASSAKLAVYFLSAFYIVLIAYYLLIIYTSYLSYPAY